MIRRLLPRVGAAVPVLATLALALAGPASAAHAAEASPAASSPSAGIYKVTTASPVLGNTTYWVYCRYGNEVTIYHQYSASTCGGDDTMGFASMTTNGNGSHSLEVCDVDSIADSYFTAVVNPANADGSASGRTIWYTDYPDGSCYLRTLGYPIRKFQVTAGTAYDGSGGQGFSDWALPS